MAATNVQAFSGDVEVASNLAVDTNVLFVDSVNNKIGVGTTSPNELVSIETGETVHYQLSVKQTDPNYRSGINIINPQNETFGIQHIGHVTSNVAVIENNSRYNGGIYSYAKGDGNFLWLTTDSIVERFRIDNNGNVGINVANPKNRLAVRQSVVGGAVGAADLQANAAISIHGYLDVNDALSIGLFDINVIDGNNPTGYIQNRWDESGVARDFTLNPAGGNCGVNTTTPYNQLHICKVANDQTSGLFLEKINNATGAAALFFGVNNTVENPGVAKAAIYYERTLSNGRGDLKFSNDASADANNVSTAAGDVRMIIKNDGKVGINSLTPGSTLDVNGQVRGYYNTDTTSYFGRAAIGYMGFSNYASLSHLSCNDGGRYGFLQQGDGETFLNCGSGKKMNFRESNVDKMVLNNGALGIATSSPGHALEVGGSTGILTRINNKSYQPHLMLQSGTAFWQLWNNGSDSHLRFYCSGDRAYLQCAGGADLLNFTGQHRTFINNIPFSQANDLQGLIVSADQNKYIKMSGGIEAGSNAITINESLPIVSLSNVVQDKRCFGVISLSEDPDTRSDCHGNMVSLFEKENGDTRVYINSVGEGALWVTNINGPLESGDYITTSNVAGYGQKQNSDSLKNYTVAKITMDCDFNPVTQPIKKLKQELGDVEYWFNTSELDVSEEEYLKLEPENRKILTNTRYSNGEYYLDVKQYEDLDSNTQSTFTEVTENRYIHIKKEYVKTYKIGLEREVRREPMNVLDEHGQIQWEDDPTGATEKAYQIRYLDADGNITDEANHVYKAAFVGCTYHCG